MPISGLLKPFIGFKMHLINVGVVVLLLQLFLLLGADYIYGAYAATVRNVLIIYFLMLLLARVYTGSRPAVMSGKESWYSFILMFIITSVVLLTLSMVPGVLTTAELTVVIPAAFAGAIGITALGFGALHAFVKAYIEEDVFRSALPIRAGLGDIISNILFGVFHFAVLVTVRGLTPVQALLPIAVLIGLGLLWSRMRNGFGIMGSVGSHFAWNLFAFGVLGKIFTGGLV